jgi:RHS repeat-associated protein
MISGEFGLDRSTTSGTTTYFIRDTTGGVIGEHVGSTSYYYLHDNEGSVVAIISASGAVQNRDAYDPYGNITSSSGTLANPFGYAGGYTDSTTGLVKFGTRYYNPAIGAFTQQDPSGASGDYIYAGDDPVNAVDPTGRGFHSFTLQSGTALTVGASLFASGTIESLLGWAGLPSWVNDIGDPFPWVKQLGADIFAAALTPIIHENS